MNRTWQRFLCQRIGLGAGIFIVLLSITALITTLFPFADPHQISSRVLLPPSTENWFGTDELGRDVLTGVIYGIQTSLLVGFSAAMIASVLGILIGGISGYFGAGIDMFVMRITEFFQVLPTFIFAAMVVAFTGPGMTRVVAVIALLAWPQTARVMRGEVMRIKQLEYVNVARCQGYGEWTILLYEVIPNSFSPVLAIGTLIVAQAILLEAGLAFFGLSDVAAISWGRMLYSGQRFLYNGWWISVFPGMAIFLTVLGFNLLGDAMGIALNPRSKT
jgi:peptide/nickel transport system permease protein